MRRLLLLLLLLPTLAFAQGDDRARELYDNGAQLYEEGRYEDAIAAWQEAYRLSEKPLLLFNIANAMERIGRYGEALDTLNRYRAFAQPDERETLDRRITNLERRLAELKDKDQSGIQVQELEAKPIGGGSTTRSSSSSGPNPAGIALLIGGLGGAGAGAGLGGAALGVRGQLADQCSTVNGANLCPSSADPLLARDRGLSVGADIGLFAGGAVAVAGLVITLVDAGKNKSASRPQTMPVFAAVPTPGGATVVLGGRF